MNAMYDNSLEFQDRLHGAEYFILCYQHVILKPVITGWAIINQKQVQRWNWKKWDKLLVYTVTFEKTVGLM